MALLKTIEHDFQEALKNKDTERLSVLRLIKTALTNKEKEKGEPPSDEVVLQILKQEAKKRDEAAALYEQSGKTDLSQKERQELELIKIYLPAELPDDAITKIIEEVKASGASEFPQIMGQVMAKLKGQADGSRVAELVKKSLD
ncbi:GatB/YqeY domain-containing protein [Candidatus Berkelbacteria bacterium]|nr:GatB/YqeY domain-containing protein [Candidatus Berkelbacteria bacterium]